MSFAVGQATNWAIDAVANGLTNCAVAVHLTTDAVAGRLTSNLPDTKPFVAIACWQPA
jgi:hypothetical protein